MAGQRVLHKVQAGVEGATHGAVPVAADTMLLGEVVLPEADREVIIPGFGTGQRIPGQLLSAFVRRIIAEGVTFSTPGDRGGLYYQLLPLLFSMCIKGNITPVEQTGSQADWLWTFIAPLTGAETLDTITLECGDDARAYELAYVFAPELTLAGNADSGEVTLTAQLFGDKITATTFTAGQSAPAATFVVGKLARLYIDATWAALGGNEIEDALLDWTLSIKGGGHPKLRGSATRLYESHGQGELEITLNLGLERSAAVQTEEDHFLSTTVAKRFVRLEIDSGVQIGTGDTHKLTFDLAGAWVGWQMFGRDQDGNALDAATLRVGVDNTSGSAFEALVTTNVAAI